jgi:hypothetical protein
MHLVLKFNAAVSSVCVTSPIAEMVLVVIPFSSVIISMLTLVPAVSVSCFKSKDDVKSV